MEKSKRQNSYFGRGTGIFTCRVCGKRTRQTGNGDNEYVQLCVACYDYAGWENTHSDNGHDDLDCTDEQKKDCPICKGITELEYATHKGNEKKIMAAREAAQVMVG